MAFTNFVVQKRDGHINYTVPGKRCHYIFTANVCRCARSFPNSNALMANWRSQTLSFKSAKDGKTNFSTPWRHAMSEPTERGMVIDEVRTFLALPKHVRLPRTFLPLGGSENLGVTCTPLNLNPNNSETL